MPFFLRANEISLLLASHSGLELDVLVPARLDPVVACRFPISQVDQIAEELVFSRGDRRNTHHLQ